jgi:2-dehydropantoate 2-reductase
MPPVHILGIGNLGKFLAHSLRKYHPTAPITLLFHRRSLAEEWEQAGQCIGIERNGVMDRVGGFDVEFIDSNVGKTTVSGEIENLIVATKTHKTVEALRSLEGRVGRSSTLLFLQNGIGIILCLFLSVLILSVIFSPSGQSKQKVQYNIGTSSLWDTTKSHILLVV